MALPSGNNTFVTPWGDKRSATVIGISLVFYGANPPQGSAQLETSNAPEQTGTGYGYPNNKGDDASIYPGSIQLITLNATTGNYDAQWQIANLAARWVRIRYIASASVSGLTVNCYATFPHESA